MAQFWKQGFRLNLHEFFFFSYISIISRRNRLRNSPCLRHCSATRRGGTREHAAQTIGSLSPRGRGWDVGVAAWPLAQSYDSRPRHPLLVFRFTLVCVHSFLPLWPRCWMDTPRFVYRGTRFKPRNSRGLRQLACVEEPVQTSPTDVEFFVVVSCNFSSSAAHRLNSTRRGTMWLESSRAPLLKEKIIFVKKYAATIFDEEISASKFFSLRWNVFHDCAR